jgi:YidC/Oxa1 family membrane protein insertase
MEKNTLAAIGLSILVLVGFQYFQQKRTGEAKRAIQSRQAAAPPSSSPAAAVPAPSAAQPQTAEKPFQSVASANTGDTTAAPLSVTVEGPLYRAVLDNRGGVLASWQLKDFTSARGEPFEMVAAGRGEDARFPGTLIFDDASATATAARENYSVEVEGGSASGPLVPPATVTMRLRRGPLVVEKTFRFLKDNYVVGLSLISEKGGQPLPGRLVIGQDIGPEHEHLINPSIQLSAVYSHSGKVSREGAPKDENEVKSIAGDLRWVGLEMQYFAVLAIPSQPIPLFQVQKRPMQAVGLDGKEFTRQLVRVTMPENGKADLRMYIGPKKQSNLQAVPGIDLSGVIDYGMFSFLVHPLLFSLKWLYQYVHNYGTSIILLTLLLTILLFPFRLKQMSSMKRMQVIQPKIKEIQDRYKKYKKTDPKRAEMNQEMMALYKEHNVNPLGGCVPLLLQMPLLFAFYQLLAQSIELRHAPFMLWIHDLAAKDPYYVLPVVMGVTMLISQKMTPMAPGSDPTQAKMMMIMPVIFTVMFINVSSGLNLYFLCSNIFQIGFQKLAERWVGDGKTPHKSKA